MYIWFESSVNSEGIETENPEMMKSYLFESSVNSEGIETIYKNIADLTGLRAV